MTFTDRATRCCRLTWWNFTDSDSTFLTRVALMSVAPIAPLFWLAQTIREDMRRQS